MGADATSENVVVGGPRDVRASLDGPSDARGCVVACPPHPQAGGTRSNPTLTRLGAALADRGLATLRFDYGPWDGGPGEVEDARRAVAWADERFGAVALFGYSFGATVVLAAAGEGTPVVAVSALAPAHRLDGLETVAALEAAAVPVQVLGAERDRVVDSTPVVERARDLGHATGWLPGDHHLVGQRGDVAERVAGFLEPRLDAAAGE